MTEIGIAPHGADSALTKLMTLFGAPPLLDNETIDRFKEVFSGLFAALGPEDFLMDSLVYHLAIETHRIFRLMRYEAQLLIKYEREQRKAFAELSRRTALEMGMKEVREKYPNAAKTDPQYLDAIAEVKKLAASDYREEMDSLPSNLDYLNASEGCADLLEKIELRIGRAVKRRDDILRQIGWHHVALARRLRKTSDAVIEGLVSQSAEEVPMIGQRMSKPDPIGTTP